MTVTSSKRKASTPSTQKAEESESLGIRYSCDYCYRDISSIVRIQCAECGLNPPEALSKPLNKSASPTPVVSLEEVDLCVECFAAGVEFSGHKKTHAYRILKPLDFALYQEDWRADEEMLLLEAVESNGIGNWMDIAEQLGTRSPEDCQNHYTQIHLKAEAFGIAAKPLSREAIEGSKLDLKNKMGKIKRAKWSNSEELLSRSPVPQSVPSNHEVAGLMPLRGEFETECENDAEMNIKDLQFAEDDSPSDRAIKFAMLDIYTGVLERRAAKHNFIFSHGLTDFKRHQQIDKMRSREEKEFYNSLKPFARFLSAEDLQKMLDGLVKEEELRRQITHLQELRKNGIRSFEEISIYDNEKRHLELYLKGGSAIVPPSSTISSMSAPVNRSTIQPASIKEPHPLPTSVVALKKSLSSAQPVPATAATLPAAINPSPVTIHIPRPLTSVAEPSAVGTRPMVLETTTPMANTSFSISTASPPSNRTPSEVPPPSTTPSNQTPISMTPASSGGRKASTPLNISHAEGVELLSEKERHLCSILRLYPRLYLSIKDTLIREYLKLGGLKRAQARGAVKIDVNKTSKLYDFFVAAGWIKPPASGE